MKLEIEHKHILKLIARDRDSDGWASISESLYKPLALNMPEELVGFEKLKTGGRARLTEEGQHVIDAMRWLG